MDTKSPAVTSGIEAVIFDLGRVLIDYQPKAWLHTLFPDVGETRGVAAQLQHEFFEGPLRAQLDLGTIDISEAAKQVVRSHPHLGSYFPAVLAGYRQALFKPIERSVRRLKPLKDRGYRLFYLSNYPGEDFVWTRAQHDFFNLFEGGVVSYEYHLGKPDPAIYQKLIQRCGVQPDRSVFLDDLPQNIDAAKKLGFHTILFEDASQIDAYFGLDMQE